MPVNLFIYGTLMRGQPRHSALRLQTFVAEVRTAPDYRLFNTGTYPALVEAPDGRLIEGELWMVSDACLNALDRIEGVAEGLYERRTVALLPPHNGLNAEAYFYLHSTQDFPDCGTRWT